jgi:hypothetical protein
MLRAIETEIDRNFDFFQRNLSQFLPTDLGRFALLRNCSVVQFCGTPFEAEMAGEAQFPDGIYSIQEVTDSPVDLGFFTYAFDQGQAG